MTHPESAELTASDFASIQRRTIRVLVAAQIFSGAGLAAGITVGALLAQDMLGSTGLAGVPSALFTVGSAAAAAGVGKLSQRWGRRPGLAAGNPPDDAHDESGVESQLRSWNPAVIAGAAVMVITQLVMVAIMTMTPVYMQHNHHSIDAAGLVIAIHVASMYLPSPISGALVDRYGPAKVAVLAAITLVAAGATASLAPPHSITALAIALALLGFGWSLGLISGTTTITNNTPLATRANTQGTVDLFIALAGASGGLLSGFVVAGASYTTLTVLGSAIAIGIVPILLTARNRLR